MIYSKQDSKERDRALTRRLDNLEHEIQLAKQMLGLDKSKQNSQTEKVNEE